MSDPLYNLYLVVAQECNLACTYCYAAGGGFGQPAQHMSERTMRLALERLLPLAGDRLTVSFFGGEPMLNFPLLKETVAFATWLADRAGKKLSFALTTNGTLLDDEMLAFVRTQISHLAISLDGGRSANAGRVFLDGAPAFDAVVRNIARLRQEDIPFALRATVTPDNVGQVLETTGFLSRQGAASVRLLPAQGVFWSGEDHRHLRAVTVELNSRGLQAMLAGETPVGCEHVYRLAAHRVAAYSPERPCLAGGGILAVGADGVAYPCEHFVGVAAFSMGHVEDAGFPGERFRAVTDRFARCAVADRPRCAACGEKDACGGQCYAEAYAATGSIERPDSRYCGLVQATFRALGPELAQGLSDPAAADRLRLAVGG